jgi:CRISPR/Cas system-associated endonuclease Cas1
MRINFPQPKHNYILDTQEYMIKFDDEEQLEYASKLIAENIYAQVNTEERRYKRIDSIIDHCKDEIASSKDEDYVLVKGKGSQKKTTDGWHSTSTGRMEQLVWIPSKD